jgi:hypothetical protein
MSAPGPQRHQVRCNEMPAFPAALSAKTRSPGRCPGLPSISKSTSWNCSLAVEGVGFTRDFTADTRIGIAADHAIMDDHIVASRTADRRRLLTLQLAMRVPGDRGGRE